MTYDPERPAGYQDADIEMAAAYATGTTIDQLHAAGLCSHTSGQTLPDGRELCTAGCGRTFASFDDLVDAKNEALYG